MPVSDSQARLPCFRVGVNGVFVEHCSALINCDMSKCFGSSSCLAVVNYLGHDVYPIMELMKLNDTIQFVAK